MYGDYRDTTRVISCGFDNPGTLTTLNRHPHLYNPGLKYVISSISGAAGDMSVLTAIITHRITAVIGKINTLRLTCIIHGFKIYVMINSGMIFNFIEY